MSRKSTSKSLSLASLAGAAVLLSALALVPAGPSVALAEIGQPGGAPTNPVFARKVSGTWCEPGQGYSTILNLSADGTMGWYGSWFFGDGSGQFYDGPVYGTWEQTGPLELTTVELGHLFNADGSYFAVGRVVQVFTFSPDFESFTYEGYEDLFGPDQDPTDPDEEPFDSFDFAGGPFKRLNHPN